MSDTSLTFFLDSIDKSAADFLRKNKDHKKFAFYGSMGAGKTTFITALCKELKTTDLVSSPTFSIINEYSTETGDTIYHFDFYRIKSSVELFDIGFEEYCMNDAWCFIEWPEKAEELVPDDFLKVYIEVGQDGNRTLKF